MRGRPDGFSFVELLMALSFLMVLLAGMGLAVNSGIRTAREIREDQRALSLAQTFADRMGRIPLGSSTDPDPAGTQLSELFDDDQDPGTITLCQLARFPTTDGGWKFSLSTSPAEGEWRITVDRDINGDGLVQGPFETDGSEIFRIQIWFNQRLVLETVRRNELSGS